MPSKSVALPTASSSSNYYISLLKKYNEPKNHHQVKKLHAVILTSDLSRDTYISNNLIQAYSKLCNITFARKVFDQMPQRNTFSWNFILSAYSKYGSLCKLTDLFHQMPHPNGFSWNSIILGHVSYGACSKALKYYQLMFEQGTQYLSRITFLAMLALSSKHGYVFLGQQIHGQILKLGFKSHPFVGSPLVGMYSKLGRMDEAKKVFDELEVKDVVAYNTLMSALSRCGKVRDVQSLFYQMDERDGITWTTMISCLAQNGFDYSAMEVFKEMRLEKNVGMDNSTFASVLMACGDLKYGKEIHAYVLRIHQNGNVFVDSALLNMYCKYGNVRYAEAIFERMSCRNVISWTAMLVGYSQNGFREKAILLFREIRKLGIIEPDDFTLGSVIGCCANLASLEEGIQFHCQALACGLISFFGVSNALISLYGKCGSMEDSVKLFNEMKIKNQVSWTALISGYSQFGDVHETIRLFEKMVESGLKPDSVTFIGILSACSRGRLVSQGHKYFDSMVEEHGIIPVSKHYSCMIDLFSRAGRLEDARKFIKNMPFRPDATSWTTLLSSCRFYGNDEIGEWAAENLQELEPFNSASYILLSGIYAGKQKWDKVANLRLKMRENRVRKEAGCSWIRHKNTVHTFLADDRCSPFSEQIYEELARLNREMIGLGYVPDTDCVLHSVEESEKIKLLNCHSEKLAIVFGLIFIPRHLPIRVFKNLRICVDCHNATKYISKITEREILVRDAARYHLFKDGACSCADFW